MPNKTVKDYIYCEDCNIAVDMWKYDSLEDSGHKDCKWRYVTAQELKELVEDCKANGCFKENIW